MTAVAVQPRRGATCQQGEQHKLRGRECAGTRRRVRALFGKGAGGGGAPAPAAPAGAPHLPLAPAQQLVDLAQLGHRCHHVGNLRSSTRRQLPSISPTPSAVRKWRQWSQRQLCRPKRVLAPQPSTPPRCAALPRPAQPPHLGPETLLQLLHLHRRVVQHVVQQRRYHRIFVPARGRRRRRSAPTNRRRSAPHNPGQTSHARARRRMRPSTCTPPGLAGGRAGGTCCPGARRAGCAPQSGRSRCSVPRRAPPSCATARRALPPRIPRLPPRPDPGAARCPTRPPRALGRASAWRRQEGGATQVAEGVRGREAAAGRARRGRARVRRRRWARPPRPAGLSHPQHQSPSQHACVRAAGSPALGGHGALGGQGRSTASSAPRPPPQRLAGATARSGW